MLVLTRRKSEVIVVGDDIRIVVVEIRGERVRIGIDAPRHIRVDRLEVATQREKGLQDDNPNG